MVITLRLFGLLSAGILLMLSASCTTIGARPTLTSQQFSVPLAAETWSLSAADAGYQGDWSVRMRTLHGGRSEGVKVLDVNNGVLSFSVVPTRGMGILSVQSGDVRLGWDSPVKEIVNPAFISLDNCGGLGWLDGFNEWMVRCGYEYAGHPGQDNGRLLSLHGRIANIPASSVDVIIEPGPAPRIRIAGVVVEQTFKFVNFTARLEVSTEVGSRSVRLHDRLENHSASDAEYQVIYHGNFGSPLLEAGAEFVGAVKKLGPFDAYAAKDLGTWTRYLGPTKGYGEQVYCLEPWADAAGQTTCMLRNKSGSRGIAISYDVNQLPYFALWKNTDTLEDGYVTGLEPATGYPYPKSLERTAGRVPRIAAGQTKEFRLDYQILPDAAAVAESAIRIQAIQAGRSTTISPDPVIVR